MHDPRRISKLRGAVLAGLVLLAAPLAAADPSLHLKIGDPQRREREAPLVLDGITDTRTGELLTVSDLPSRLAGTRLLLIGESHTDMDFHRVQLRVIEELVRAGRRVFVGLEMYPYTEQRFLDDWEGGFLTEEGFLHLSRWYESWGYSWAYYRDIFLFARDHREQGVRLFAVNAPRDVVTEVRKKGFASLSPEAAAHIPKDILPSDAEHRALFQSYFTADDSLHSGMTEDQWGGMLSAQTTWDATMAHNGVKALLEQGGAAAGKPEAILVLLAGSGHVAYGVGIARQAAHQAAGRLDGKIATLVPVNVAGDDGAAVRSVQASYADFVWGVPAVTDALYPSLGLSTKARVEGGGLEVILVSDETPAARAGVLVGDVLRALDSAAVDSKGAFNEVMAGKRWGDRVVLALERGGKELKVEVPLRRSVAREEPKPENAKPKE